MAVRDYAAADARGSRARTLPFVSGQIPHSPGTGRCARSFGPPAAAAPLFIVSGVRVLRRPRRTGTNRKSSGPEKARNSFWIGAAEPPGVPRTSCQARRAHARNVGTSRVARRWCEAAILVAALDHRDRLRSARCEIAVAGWRTWEVDRAFASG